MGFLESRSLVLRATDFGESDRIVSFLTRDHGKLRAIAKGARASRKRFGWNLEPLSLVQLRVWETVAGKGLARIETCDLVKPFGLTGDLPRFAAGSYAIELIESFTWEGEPSAGVFDLAAGFVDVVGSEVFRPDHLRIFELRLAAEAGYAPAIDSCIGCATPREKVERGLFLVERGATLCERCARAHRGGGYPLSRITLDFFSRVLTADGEDLWTLEVPEPSSRECARMLPGFLAATAGREIRSLRFLREVWPEGIAD